ncbi:MAG: putative toxin-antitoxin system toxin component, PIN family [Pseudomonadota bacterium]
MKIPIVIDTNVLISGYLWSGKPRQAIKIISNSPYQLLYCHESLTELVRILSEKFHLSPDEIIRIVSNIKHIGKQVHIASDESPISEDVSDNLFINLAIDGSAKTIISGDSHLLKLKEFKGIEIIKVADFLVNTSGHTTGIGYRGKGKRK